MVAKANSKLRDATEQLREVLMHKLRSDARIEQMEKQLAVVKENRQKHQEGDWRNPVGGIIYQVPMIACWVIQAATT